MNLPNIFALVPLALGFFIGIDRLNTLHSQFHAQAEIAWWQPPLSLWKYETLSMLTIAIHSLGLIGLAACLLLNLTHHPILTFPPNPPELFLLAWVGIVFTAYSSGIMLAYHLVRHWIGPVSYGICNAGVLYGDSLIGWKSYSHYEIGPDDGQISLYSSYSPSLRTWVLQPSQESYLGVLALIQKNLSSASIIDDSPSWQHSPFVLIVAMTALVLCALLPAIWGLSQNQSWVWIYALVAFFLVNILGNRWMTVYDGRGKYPEQDGEAA